MDIFSVVVCTRNRAAMLVQVLESLDRQTLDRSKFEVLVIDNGSTDETAQIAAHWQDSREIQYYYEEKPGLSRARNRGWREAQGDWVLYLDDDAVASPWWLEGFSAAILKLGASVGCFGGQIGLVWPEAPPQWLPKRLKGFLGELDRGPVPRVLSDNEWIGGGNSAFRRNLLENLGGFPEQLGRQGNNLLSCEESFLRRQIVRSGFDCGYAPQAFIWHYVAQSRLTKEWFWRRSFWQGVSSARSDLLIDISSRWKHVIFTLGRLIRELFVFLIKLFSDESHRFDLLSRIVQTIGRLKGLLTP